MLITSVRWTGKLLLRVGVGLLGLVVFNVFGKLIGLIIPLNLITILITGCLGVPGIALLVSLSQLY